MFKVGPIPQPVEDSTLAVAAQIDPPTIGHWQDGGVAHGIHAVTQARRFVGTAFTVRLSDMDATAIHYAIDRLQPGHVLVVDMGGDLERACLGAVLAFLAKHKGAHGVVIDGMATDLVELEEIGMPVFARGITAITTRMLGLEGDVNVPVVINGVVVTPGQVVIGTADGVLFIDEADLLRVADRAIAVQNSETQMKVDLEAGASVAELSGALKAMEGKIVPYPYIA